MEGIIWEGPGYYASDGRTWWLVCTADEEEAEGVQPGAIAHEKMLGTPRYFGNVEEFYSL